MTQLFSREQILEGLILAMSDCLAIEPGDITSESALNQANLRLIQISR